MADRWRERGFRAWWKRRFGPRIPKLYRDQAKFAARYPKHRVGVGTYGMPEVHDWGQGTTLTIGAYSSIADDVHIFLGGDHRTDWVSCYPFPAYLEEAREIPDYEVTKGDVVVGNDVWLGSGSLILSGVTIGDGAVVAARSVVTRDVAPYSIVAGNPARHIRWRFEDEALRAALLATAWWSWPEAEVRRVVHLLCSNNVRAFLDYAAARTPQVSSGENA